MRLNAITAARPPPCLTGQLGRHAQQAQLVQQQAQGGLRLAGLADDLSHGHRSVPAVNTG